MFFFAIGHHTEMAKTTCPETEIKLKNKARKPEIAQGCKEPQRYLAISASCRDIKTNGHQKTTKEERKLRQTASVREGPHCAPAKAQIVLPYETIYIYIYTYIYRDRDR